MQFVTLTTYVFTENYYNNNITGENMSFNNEIELIKVLGWSKTSKIVYIMNQLKTKSKEDVYNELVTENKVMKSKSFNVYLNTINRIKDDIQFV